MFSPTDTIVAIATPPGRGGIGVVRVSGPGAHDVARKILATSTALVPRVATFAHVMGTDASSDARVATSGESDGRSSERWWGRAIDEVIATFFAGPTSYTGEDVLEIAAHGSPVVLETIVRAAIRAGARLAEPGEFTLRAFLNGRIDLVQAEAVADLVDAVTPLQARAAFDQLEGTLTSAIGRIDAALFEVIARLEASIDFPNEGYHFITAGEAESELRRIVAEIGELTRDARRGRVVREGRQVAIIGKPNVGKSTLFNHLLGSNRAIVTPMAGTTRDLVTEVVDLDGLRVRLTDTAGVREPGDDVEREGVARAVGAAAVADVIVLVLDASRPLDDDDRRLLETARKGEGLVVINKCDLPRAWQPARLDCDTGGRPVEISLRSGAGVAQLKQRLATQLLGSDRLRDVPAVTNVRHIDLLERAQAAIGRGVEAVVGSRGEVPEEFLLVDLQEARGALEEVTGRRTTEDLLRHIFGRFCVGK